MATFRPADFQPLLPVDELIREEAPGEEAVTLDVVFVGGGPAGLAGAIELARLAKKTGTELEIGVMEKAERLGDHCLSGAVVNPIAFRELFPELEDKDFPFRTPVTRERVYLMTQGGQIRLPTPPTMRNHGHYVASICELTRWLGEKAEELASTSSRGFPSTLFWSRARRSAASAQRRPAWTRKDDRAVPTSHRPTSPRGSPCSRKEHVVRCHRLT